MGIDIYMAWDNMTAEEKERQITGFSIVSGNTGYLREAYHGGPYATRLLVPEAFDEAEARIPAKLLRQRLTNPCEPDPSWEGHTFGEAVHDMIRDLAENDGGTVMPHSIRKDTNQSFTVEEAVLERYKDDPALAARVLQSFREFVELAERKERETGEHVRIVASW